MQTQIRSSARCRRFKSIFRSRGADPRNCAGKRQHANPAPPVWEKGEIVSVFGGSPREHAVAGEWYSDFQHEATFLSEVLPVTIPQPNLTKPIQGRILVADDDSLVRGSLTAVLESEGYMVDEARDGIEAVSRATTHLPDLVLLDINMPQWDGWTAFLHLDRVTPLLPVIVITARPNQYRTAVRLGVDAFMEKPLNIPVLVHAIKRLTNEDGSSHERRITDPAFVTELL